MFCRIENSVPGAEVAGHRPDRRAPATTAAGAAYLAGSSCAGFHLSESGTGWSRAPLRLRRRRPRPRPRHRTLRTESRPPRPGHARTKDALVAETCAAGAGRSAERPCAVEVIAGDSPTGTAGPLPAATRVLRFFEAGAAPRQSTRPVLEAWAHLPWGEAERTGGSA